MVFGSRVLERVVQFSFPGLMVTYLLLEPVHSAFSLIEWSNLSNVFGIKAPDINLQVNLTHIPCSVLQVS